MNAVDLDKLCVAHSWFTHERYDANYLAHEPAEIDLAEIVCKLALAGKFNTFRPVNLDPALITDVKLAVGFNCILDLLGFLWKIDHRLRSHKEYFLHQQ